MIDDEQELERKAIEAYARILAESRLTPQVAESQFAAPPVEKVTEVHVTPEGAVHIRVGTPAALRAMADPSPVSEHHAQAADIGCIWPDKCIKHEDFWHLHDLPSTPDLEGLLSSRLSATGESRSQLLTHLWQQAMIQLLQEQAVALSPPVLQTAPGPAQASTASPDASPAATEDSAGDLADGGA